MKIIGIDSGSTNVKLIEVDEKFNIINKMFLEKRPIKDALDEFIRFRNIDIKNISNIVLTGVGSSEIEEDTIYGIKVLRQDEFISIANGGKYLSKKDRAIIVSIGTGTAFVRTDRDEINHIGGTGVGGGTLINMCKRFAGVNNFDEIRELCKKGDLSKIDLRISDVSKIEIPTLPKDITAANFGKLEEDANNADIVLGIVNTIFETIAMLAVFATRNDDIKDVVLIGNIVTLPDLAQIIKKIEMLYKINFIIPENPEYAVALGAIVSTINKI